MHILEVLRIATLPDGYISGGVIRNIVWDHLHGYTASSFLPDIDVIYYDPDNLDPMQEESYRSILAGLLPDVRWDVANQAAVHLWYEERYGVQIQPLRSIPDALTTWLETMTAVAVRLTNTDSIQIIAPFGLEDLFGMVVRRNSYRVTDAFYRKRLRQKEYSRRWPKVVFAQ